MREITFFSVEIFFILFDIFSRCLLLSCELRVPPRRCCSCMYIFKKGHFQGSVSETVADTTPRASTTVSIGGEQMDLIFSKVASFFSFCVCVCFGPEGGPAYFLTAHLSGLCNNVARADPFSPFVISCCYNP